MLPWGAVLPIQPSDSIGRAIWHTGVYDLVVTEALLRLLDVGEMAMDIGANIGYMTSVMAAAVTSKGRVLAVEPHPVLAHELEATLRVWREALGWDHVELSRLAISDREGTARLYIPQSFSKNRGLATLANVEGGTAAIDVAAKLLDQILGDRSVAMLKVDVEGHESSVMRGGMRSLEAGSIRDIIYEEYQRPSPVAELLRSSGYRIYFLRQGFSGPKLLDPDQCFPDLSWETPNYLATLDPSRARQRMSVRGWSSFRRS